MIGEVDSLDLPQVGDHQLYLNAKGYFDDFSSNFYARCLSWLNLKSIFLIKLLKKHRRQNHKSAYECAQCMVILYVDTKYGDLIC